MSRQTTDYTEVDQAILARLGQGSATFMSINAALGALASKYAAPDAPPEEHFRVIDRRLQALRRAKKIKFTHADGWSLLPQILMTNISIEPRQGSLSEIIGDTDDCIFMMTNSSCSIDDKRINFQFGCEAAWRIEHGTLTTMYKNPNYTGITPEFWGSCDAVAGREEWVVWGTPNCGKGQPGQVGRVGHGASPARFRNVQVGVR